MMTARPRAKTRATILAGLAALVSCSSGPASNPREADSTPVDLPFVRQLGRTHQQYVNALLLCGSRQPIDWEEARRQLEVIQPYHVFDEDPELIRRFRAGDPAARAELGRRGLILDALLVFPKGYDRGKWEGAQKILMDAGKPGQILLSTTLIQILMNGQYREIWDPVRTALVEAGPVALETVIGWARELVSLTPGETPIFRIDDLAGAGVTLVAFGDPGLSVFDEIAKSPKRNVRRAWARALAEAVLSGEATTMSAALTRVGLLVQMLSQDPEWTVRTAAAEALGKMSGARVLAGRALCDRMKKERDRAALRAILESIGELKYPDSVPDLMIMLEVPAVETADLAMMALYHVTGQRLTRKEQWLRWYATEYAQWKARSR